MDAVWLIIAFLVGGTIGFFLFALLHLSRRAMRHPKTKLHAVLQSFEFEGDTITRF